MKTIKSFCAAHNACAEGRQWALAHCSDMTDVWRQAKPDWLIWVATRPGVLTERDLRLFACWSVRQVWHLLTDERSRSAVEVSEWYALGAASREELAAARAAAEYAARVTAKYEARAAARLAAEYAARAAARAAAMDAAWATAMDAAWAAAMNAAQAAFNAAAWDAARDAAWDAQADWLRMNTTPTF